MKELPNELDVRGTVIRVIKINGEGFVCLTDMAKLKSEDAQQTISNWMRNRMTLEYNALHPPHVSEAVGDQGPSGGGAGICLRRAGDRALTAPPPGGGRQATDRLSRSSDKDG